MRSKRPCERWEVSDHHFSVHLGETKSFVHQGSIIKGIHVPDHWQLNTRAKEKKSLQSKLRIQVFFWEPAAYKRILEWAETQLYTSLCCQEKQRKAKKAWKSWNNSKSMSRQSRWAEAWLDAESWVACRETSLCICVTWRPWGFAQWPHTVPRRNSLGTSHVSGWQRWMGLCHNRAF